jgi:ABC-type glycerol-3-phosphate transport system substrate-binding protein
MGKTHLIAAAVTLAFVVAACGSSDGGSAEPAAEPAAAPAAEPAAAPAAEPAGECGEEVDLLIFSSRDYYQPPDLWEGLMERCPNISVKVQVESNDDILQQLQRMNDAGQRLPDVIQDDTFLIEAYQNAGLILDHTEQKDRWEADDPDTYNDILPIAWEENTFNDGIWGTSLTANFDVIYYNVAVCEEAGVDCAGIATLDEFRDALRAVKASGSDAIPLSAQALPGTGITTLKTFFSAAGAPFDGAVPDMQSEGGLYTLQWFLDASNEGLLPSQAISWGEDEARGAFAGQRAAFILDGFTVAGEFNEIPAKGGALCRHRRPDRVTRSRTLAPGPSRPGPIIPTRQCWQSATSARSSSSSPPPETVRCRCATAQRCKTRASMSSGRSSTPTCALRTKAATQFPPASTAVRSKSNSRSSGVRLSPEPT